MKHAPGEQGIRHLPEEGRFEMTGAATGAALTYREEGSVIAIERVFVPPTLRGGGVAGTLTRAALAYARARGRKVQPDCSYADAYLRRHAEWGDLRA
ncbi:MAG: GNAT family N-acetyltransferase [Opitutales bacterium]